MSLSAYCRLKKEILYKAVERLIECPDPDACINIRDIEDLVTDDQVLDYIRNLEETVDDFYDVYQEEETFLRDDYDIVILPDKSPSEVYYLESRYVCKQFNDVYIAWVYYYGGGKHSYPGGIEWLTTARYIDVRKEIRSLPIYVIQSEDFEKEIIVLA